MTLKTLPPSTTIPSPWLRPARIAWVLLATITILLFMITTLELIYTPLPNCTGAGPSCPPNTPLSNEDIQIAAEMGLPIPLKFLALSFSLAAKISLALIGLIIFWRKSDDWVAMLMSGALLTVLLEGIPVSNGFFATLLGLLLGIGTALFLPIPFIFPSGEIHPRWMRWPMIALTISFTALVTFALQAPWYSSVGAAFIILWTILAIYAMPYRYFRISNVQERQQTKWVLLGLATTLMVGIYYSLVTIIYPVSAPSEARIIALIINMPIYLGSYSFFAFSTLVAILRYRLWDIDIIIRRTLQYTILTGLLALTYFGGVVILQNTLTPLTGSANSPFMTVLTTLTIAVLFTPLRRQVQDFIDRRFFRKKYNAEQVLANFAIVARDEVDMDKLATALLNVIEETVQPEKVTLWLKQTTPKQ